MFLDVIVIFKNGDQEYYIILLCIMCGVKKMDGNVEWIIVVDWLWINFIYEFELLVVMKWISLIEIDVSGWMFDIDCDDNCWEQEDQNRYIVF